MRKALRLDLINRGICIGHASPEAALGGPWSLIQDSDIIDIDANRSTVEVRLSDRELDERQRRWQAPPAVRGGLLEKYSNTVGTARYGAVTHTSAVEWPKDSPEDP
jgi:dihydroxy-acid dehydratase